MIKQLLVVFGLLALAMAAFSSLTTGTAATTKKAAKKFVKTLGPYKVQLTEVKDAPGDGTYWGEFNDHSDVYVDDLSIWYKGQEIDEPFSCYSDLANVDEMKIMPVKGGLVINIGGGDAGAAYTAQIVVKGGQVVRRSVKDGEMPENSWEKTEYHEDFSDVK